MTFKTSLFHCTALALTLATLPVFSSVARAQNTADSAKSALPEKIGTTPLAQVKGDGVTIQLQRARWASGREVLLWRRMDKALTLWFEAQTVPEIAIPEGLTAADYIVNVRLIDEKGRAVEVLPVDPVRSLHRSSLGYVPISPKLELNGQSLWRVQSFDPNFKAVKIQIEWLKPGSPFNSKTAPESLLQLEKDAPIPPEAASWLQRLELPLTAEQIEIGPLQAAPTVVAEWKNDDYQARLYRWQLGSTKIVSDTEQTFSTIQTGLVVTALNDEAAKKLSGQIMITARNQKGEDLKKMSFDFDAGRYFAPDGMPLKSNQRNFSASLDFDEKPFEIAGPWSLEVRSYDKETSLIQLGELPQPEAVERKTK